MARRWVIGLVVALAACNQPAKSDAAKQAPAPAAKEAAPAAKEAAPAKADAKTQATPPAKGADGKETKKRIARPKHHFPKRDLSCKADADCALSHHTLDGQGYCCMLCKASVGTKDWVEKVAEFCQRFPKPSCPKADCATDPPVRCQDGRCVSGKPKK